ncbi:helicase associated domain-containing protein [Prescottella agglutinans]|uniref:helicase associated domain-containing protein n=1 Tax=Prescottella agglutinans TaxID=1644129 RepID=UPI002475F458|nr:helicase associated domain-containing protein [Prescottella agglutinans]
MWVRNKRTDRRIGRPSLSTDRIDQLDSLGFDWGRVPTNIVARRTQWDNAVDRLAQFVAEHGHARIPQAWVCPDGFELGSWAGRRRNERRAGTPTLTPSRIAQLDALGFEWEPPRGPRMT